LDRCSIVNVDIVAAGLGREFGEPQLHPVQNVGSPDYVGTIEVVTVIARPCGRFDIALIREIVPRGQVIRCWTAAVDVRDATDG